jgi:hypothetical protein
MFTDSVAFAAVKFQAGRLQPPALFSLDMTLCASPLTPTPAILGIPFTPPRSYNRYRA